MDSVIHMLERVFLEKLSSDEAPLAMKSDAMQSVFAVCAFFACVGLSFLIYGTHLRLIDNYSPDLAAAITGGVSIGLSLLIGGVAYSVLKYRESQIKKFRQGIIKKTQSTLSLLNDEFGEPIRDNPKMALLIAAVAGFAFEKRIL